jgi:hypothetical protein
MLFIMEFSYWYNKFMHLISFLSTQLLLYPYWIFNKGFTFSNLTLFIGNKNFFSGLATTLSNHLRKSTLLFICLFSLSFSHSLPPSCPIHFGYPFVQPFNSGMKTRLLIGKVKICKSIFSSSFFSWTSSRMLECLSAEYSDVSVCQESWFWMCQARQCFKARKNTMPTVSS